MACQGLLLYIITLTNFTHNNRTDNKIPVAKCVCLLYHLFKEDLCMKNDSIKTFSALSFFVFYVASIYLSSSPPKNYANVFNTIAAVAVLCSFYFMTFAFAGNKKFLTTVTLYFVLVFFALIMLTLFGNVQGFKWIMAIFAIIMLSCLFPFVYLDSIKIVSEKISPNFDISGILILAFLIITFYTVYFISIRIKERRNIE